MSVEPRVTDTVDSPVAGEPFIVMNDITKRFSGAVAVNGVTVEIRPGEIHSIVGANGAGKSTLGKMLAGVHAHDGGELVVDGEPVTFNSPADALQRGVAIMQQEIALAEKLSVIDNVFLGTEFGAGIFVSRKRQAAEFEQLRARTGFAIDANSIVEDLRLGEQQQVSVLWALAREARLIVMDEPTASLDREDAHRLLDTAKKLAAEGIAVVFVSHFLDEVLAISDRVTVMANGELVCTKDASELDEATLVEAMLGGALEEAFPPLVACIDSAEVPVFVADGITIDGQIENISLSIRPGEIVGMYGLVGSGRSEFAHAISGSVKRVRGTVRVQGKEQQFRSPKQAIDAGVTLLPESRKDQGLMLGRSVLENTALAALDRFTNSFGVVRERRMRAETIEVLNPMVLRGGNRLDEEVGNFSGGNQQKVLLAKCLLTKPKLLILDEPTRGVDIGAKRAIYDVIMQIAAAGTAVLLITSEEAEVLHLCHQIKVLREGQIAASFGHGEADEHQLLAAALGATGESDFESEK